LHDPLSLSGEVFAAIGGGEESGRSECAPFRFFAGTSPEGKSRKCGGGLVNRSDNSLRMFGRIFEKMVCDSFEVGGRFGRPTKLH